MPNIHVGFRKVGECSDEIYIRQWRLRSNLVSLAARLNSKESRLERANDNSNKG